MFTEIVNYDEYLSITFLISYFITNRVSEINIPDSFDVVVYYFIIWIIFLWSFTINFINKNPKFMLLHLI